LENRMFLNRAGSFFGAEFAPKLQFGVRGEPL